MPDLVITATNVTPGTSAVTTHGLAGELVTAGQVLYRKTDGKYYKAGCAVTATEAKAAGVALNGASPNQSVTIQTDGDLQIGAVTAKTTTYVLSATLGGICPQADLVAGNRIVHIGYARDAAGAFTVHRVNTGVSV